MVSGCTVNTWQSPAAWVTDSLLVNVSPLPPPCECRVGRICGYRLRTRNPSAAISLRPRALPGSSAFCSKVPCPFCRCVAIHARPRPLEEAQGLIMASLTCQGHAPAEIPSESRWLLTEPAPGLELSRGTLPIKLASLGTGPSRSAARD